MDILSARSPKVQADQRKLLAVYKTIVSGRSATYVSSPLTTGERLAEWLLQSPRPLEKGPDYQEQLRKFVVEPNRKAAAEFVAHLRQYEGAVVIDPTALPDMPGWEQEDYHSFWVEVIRQFVAKVIFMDGWNYSTGCSYEFLTAHRTHAQTFNQAMRPLSLSNGALLIRDAINRLDDLALATNSLERIAAALDEEACRERTA